MLTTRLIAMFDQLLPEICIVICRYLKARERARVAMVSKSMEIASRASFIYRSYITNGELPRNDVNDFTILIDTLRFAALITEPSPFSEEVRENVKSVNDIRLLSAKDIAILDRTLYQHWEHGIFDYAIQIAQINPHITCMHKVPRLETWKYDCIFGCFYVLLHRSDGTVLISENMENVYLVLQAREMIQQSHIALPGKIIACILPYEGYLVSDGKVGLEPWWKPLNASVKKVLYDIYARAVDTHTLVHTGRNTCPPVIVSLDGMKGYNSSHFNAGQLALQTALMEMPKLQGDQGVWAFARHNQNGLIRHVFIRTVLEGDRAIALGTVWVLPRRSVECVLAKLEDIVTRGCEHVPVGFAPHMIFVDDSFTVACLKHYLKECEIKIYNLCIPDEVIYTCNHCRQLETAHFKLKLCSRCKLFKYCDVSCQRADWKCHKKHCRKAS